MRAATPVLTVASARLSAPAPGASASEFRLALFHQLHKGTRCL